MKLLHKEVIPALLSIFLRDKRELIHLCLNPIRFCCNLSKACANTFSYTWFSTLMAIPTDWQNVVADFLGIMKEA